MKKFIFSTLVLLLVQHSLQSQGCIAVRAIAGFGQYGQMEYNSSSSKWFVNVNNRYFRSFRTFKGTADQHTPKKDEVVNKVFTTDITLLRLFNNGWSVTLDVPVIDNSRSTAFEHGGKRHATRSFGLGDLRFTLYKWLADPQTHAKGNVQIGLGLKLPTGDYKFQDYYYQNDSTRILNPVDQSIQLGDGGTGLIAELNAFYTIGKSLHLYGNLFYMANPREQNGVSTAKNGPVSAISIKAGAEVMSVPDQYTIRAGVKYMPKNLGIEGGLRAEGVPVNDLIGESGGLRRAGYNISIEPGLSYKLKNCLVYVYVPVSLKRSISQSVTDKKLTNLTGVYTISPGGYADYLVFAGISFRL